MTDPAVTGSANLVQVLTSAKEYLSDFRPQTRSVRYNYRERTSEMTFLIEVPDSRERKLSDVEIPVLGYRVKDMFSMPDYKSVESAIVHKDEYITFDPDALPGHNEFILTLTGNVDPDTLKELVHLKVPEDPQTKDELDKYWVHSAIKRPSIMKEVYDDLQIDNVDLSVQVGVQRCFSSTIPQDVLDLFDKTRELMEASDKYNRNKLRSAGKRRHEALQSINTQPGEAADFLRSLATAEHIQDFISVDSPYRRRNINPELSNNRPIPETIDVDITTDLDLDNRAADGEIVFEKGDYEEYIGDMMDEELG